MKPSFVITLFVLFTTGGILSISCSRSSDEISERLEEEFLSPPQEAKPIVWWHWVDDNITKEGIKADLEWMKRIGIGGFHQFEISLKTTNVVKVPLKYMSEEWKEASRYAVKLADSLNLEAGIASSCGWSESGGPWVKPEAAMKKYVWSEINIEGGKPFCGKLPQPPGTTGTFQDVPNGPSRFGTIPYWFSYKDKYYKDAVVVAYRIPQNELLVDDSHPKVISSGGKFNIRQLADNNLAETVLLPAKRNGEDSWILFEFSTPTLLQSVSLAARDHSIKSSRTIEVSQNGHVFQKIGDFLPDDSPQTTITFPPVTGRFYRIVFHLSDNSKASNDAEDAGIQVGEIRLYSAAHVNRFEDKAGFVALNGYKNGLYTFETPCVSDSNSVIKKKNVIDITSKMEPDGTLNWNPPEGKWCILRIGYSLTGKTNHPAPLEATGLEVDKLGRRYVREYFTHYLDIYQDITAGLKGKGIKSMVTDSWEAGTLNWTDN